jgi:hypothetical protein
MLVLMKLGSIERRCQLCDFGKLVTMFALFVLSTFVLQLAVFSYVWPMMKLEMFGWLYIL